MEQEKLSALVDGELDESDMQALTQELGHPEALARIEAYYRIGEELRADSAKTTLDPEFATRMSAALAAEPPLETRGPVSLEMDQNQAEGAEHSDQGSKPAESAPMHSLKQLVPGLVAMAAVAVILSPQYMFIIQTNASVVSQSAFVNLSLSASKFIG